MTAAAAEIGAGTAARGPTREPVPSCPRSIVIGGRLLPSRYFLAPLDGYTNLPLRTVLRKRGGLGHCTTDLVQAVHLVHGHWRARERIRTAPDDRPLTVQIYGGKTDELVRAAQWLEDHGYEAVDVNMGCPMAKMVGTGGGARLMCDPDGACNLVRRLLEAVKIPITVKMRLGWDRSQITAPELARRFEEQGVAAVTIHGRTRQQGFGGSVHLDLIGAVVDSVRSIPVIGNGDVRTVDDAFRMQRRTGCAAVAIGRGALLDPWIFRRIERRVDGLPDEDPSPQEQLEFLKEHFFLLVEHTRSERPPRGGRGEAIEPACMEFRKFAAWYGARLGIPEDLEDRLRRFESVAEFERLFAEIAARHGTRRSPVATAEVKVPNGPVEYW